MIRVFSCSETRWGGRDAEYCLNLAVQGAAFDVVYCARL